MAGETFAFASRYDNALLIKHDLEKVLGCNIAHIMCTNSKQLNDLLTRAKYTTERRMMIETAAARDTYNGKKSYPILDSSDPGTT